MDSGKTTGQTVKLNLAGIVNDSIVDGPGIRVCIFAQGCSHNCAGCHNPETHSFGTGKDYRVEELVSLIKQNPLVKGVTFSGGDPFFQSRGFYILGKELRAMGYEVAAYTGFLWKELIEGTQDQQRLLSVLNVLVDGPFIQELRNLDLPFKGSINQNFIDVQKSLTRQEEGKTLFHRQPKVFERWERTFLYT